MSNNTPITDSEEQAKAGLNVSGYHFKWKQARALAEQNQRTDDGCILPYWERVRLLFLELGGRYDGQKD